MNLILLALALALAAPALPQDEEAGEAAAETPALIEADATPEPMKLRQMVDKAPPPNPVSNDDCKGPPLPTGRFVVSNPNGWWPRVSPDGEWVAFGNRALGVVSVRTRAEQSIPADDCIYPNGWIRNGVLRANNRCDGRAFKLTAPGFALQQTKDDPGLAIGNQGVAADGHWATWLASAGRIAYDNKELVTGVGGAIDVSGNWLVHAKDGEHTAISVWKHGVHALDLPIKTPLFQLTVTGGYIVYGYGRIHGITPAGKDIDLTVAPPGFMEQLGKVFFVRVSSTSSVPWVASCIWKDPGGCFTMLRPWGERSGIVLDDCAADMTVVEHCGVAVVARCSDKGKLTIVSLPIATKRTSPAADLSAGLDAIKFGQDLLKKRSP